jgi:hypothetical protein
MPRPLCSTVAAAVLVLGCSARPPIVLRTLSAPNPGCLQAVLGGELAVDDVTGLGLVGNGNRQHVTWPYGWTTRTDGSRIALVGRQGQMLAHVGYQVTMGGGNVGDGTAEICETDDPPIHVVTRPMPTPAT